MLVGEHCCDLTMWLVVVVVVSADVFPPPSTHPPIQDPGTTPIYAKPLGSPGYRCLREQTEPLANRPGRLEIFPRRRSGASPPPIPPPAKVLRWALLAW